MCKIADTSRVSVSLRNMELIPAGEVAQFEITVDGTSNSELAVAVKGKTLAVVCRFVPLPHSEYSSPPHRSDGQFAGQNIGRCAEHVHGRVHCA